jgi:hypothetical protein
LNEIEKHGFCNSKYVAICAKDWYLCFEGAKTMPFFRKLANSDQVYFFLRGKKMNIEDRTANNIMKINV